MRNITINLNGATGVTCSPDAVIAILEKIRDLELKYANNSASVANLTSAKVVVTGATPYKIHVFTVTSVMSSGTYTVLFNETVPNVERATSL